MRRHFTGATNGSSGTTVSNTSIFVTRTMTSPLPSGKKYIDVQLLTRDHLYLAVDVKCKVQDVYYCVCGHLGLQDSRLFGLAVFVNGEYRFLDLNEKLSKCAAAPKNWIKSSGWGTDLVGNPSVIIYLRVHTFVEFVGIINCPIALYHYYLQLRENVRVQWEPSWIREERCFETAALALQADFGDYNGQRHKTGYFRPDNYFPLWVINSRGLDFVVRHMPSMHQDLRGLDVNDAKVKFCREVSKSPWPVNMHLYKLRKCKNDAQDNIFLGITASGLDFFQQRNDGERDHLISFLWSRIGKVQFERRKFTVNSVDGQKLIFYTNSDEKSRYLLLFCRSLHQNIMSLQPEIVEARKRESQERKHFRESYIYSDRTDLEWVRDHGNLPISFHEYYLPKASSSLNLQSHTLVSGQRVSLVSDASSNTTSGIVSDRQQNHDDSENENVLASFDDDIDYETCESASQLLSSSSIHLSSSTPHSFGDGVGSLKNSPCNLVGSTPLVVERNKADANAAVDDVTGDFSVEKHCNVVGPSSDRTMTALSDDGQSIGTTSTTEKLEDVVTDAESNCPENRKLSLISNLESKSSTTVLPPGDDQLLRELASDAESKIHRELSSLIAKSMENLRMSTSSRASVASNAALQPPDNTNAKTGSIRSQISIAELRNKTLNGYNLSKYATKLSDVPILNGPNLAVTLSSSESNILMETETAPVHKKMASGRLMKSLATQTNGTYLSCFKSKDDELDDHQQQQQNQSQLQQQEEASEPSLQPCIVVVSSKEREHQLKDNTTHKTYRLSSFDSELSDCGNNSMPPPSSPPKMGVSSLSTTATTSSVERVFSPKTSASLFSPNFQSYSMSNLPTSINNHSNTNINCRNEDLNSTTSLALSCTEPPDYEQAMMQKAERQAGNNRRWPTISGVDWADLANHMSSHSTSRDASSLYYNGTGRPLGVGNSLQQAQSEPGLAFADNLPATPMHLLHRSVVVDSCLSSAYNKPLLVGQQQQQQYVGQCEFSPYPPPVVGCSGQFPPTPPYVYNNNNFPQQHNGLYIKHPPANRWSPNIVGLASRMHPVNRVHSVQHETAIANQIRKQLIQEEKQRRLQHSAAMQQQQNRRAAVHGNKNDANYFRTPSDERRLHRHSSDTQDLSTLAASTNFAGGNNVHSLHHHKRYCSTCHEDHQAAGKIDLAQLKTMIRDQAVDLPMIRALCNDGTLENMAAVTSSSSSRDDECSGNNNNNNVVMRKRSKRVPPPPPLDYNANEPSCSALSTPCRPRSWHELSFVATAATDHDRFVDNILGRGGEQQTHNGYYIPQSPYQHQPTGVYRLPYKNLSQQQHHSFYHQPSYQHQPVGCFPPTPSSPSGRFASTPNLLMSGSNVVDFVRLDDESPSSALPPPPPYPSCLEQNNRSDHAIGGVGGGISFYSGPFQVVQHPNYFEQAIR